MKDKENKQCSSLVGETHSLRCLLFKEILRSKKIQPNEKRRHVEVTSGAVGKLEASRVSFLTFHA